MSLVIFSWKHFLSSEMLLEETLALAVKNYRIIVDSRRFISLATHEEFKKAFDTILAGLLENLSECFTTQKQDEKTKNQLVVILYQKKTLIATEILRILIILKHFINDPVFSDDIGHGIFELAGKNYKISCESSENDNFKAEKVFESFVVTLYVLFCEDESLNQNAKRFFKSMTPGRFQLLLLEAAPRASQEEIYHKTYRKMLLRIGSFTGDASIIIKRLDSYYPESSMIEGMSRKNFLLFKLGWKVNTIYHCADKLIEQINKSFDQNKIKEAAKGIENLWFIIADCKFVAVDQCCATLFIFPSESDSFLKITSALQIAFTKLKSSLLNEKIDNYSVCSKKILNINLELYNWVEKLVKALTSNYIHFEQDLTNQTSAQTNRLLYKIILVLVNLSKDIHETIKESLKTSKPIGELKLVADYIEKGQNSLALQNGADVAYDDMSEQVNVKYSEKDCIESKESTIDLINVSFKDLESDQYNTVKDHSYQHQEYDFESNKQIAIVIPTSPPAAVEEIPIPKPKVPIIIIIVEIVSLFAGFYSLAEAIKKMIK